MKLFNKGKLFALSMLALSLVFFSCKVEPETSPSANPEEEQYGSLTINTSSSDNIRSVYADDIKSAVVKVSGFDSKGNVFTKSSDAVNVSAGKASGITVEKIPVCKNVVVKVLAFSRDDATGSLEDYTLTAVTDINSGSNSTNVNWSSTVKGNVYAALLSESVNTNTLTSEEITSINNAIPSDTHAFLVNSAAIASDFKSGNLASSSTYKLTAGTVNVTCNEYSGCTLQLSDPMSTTVTASTSSPVSITNAAPGTWTLYVLDGTTVKTTKIVNVAGGENVAVTVGTAAFTGIQIQVAKSLGYPLIHYWSCSDNTNYPNTKWPGTAMLTDWNDSDYIFNFANCSSVNLLITNSGEGKLCSSDIKITSAGSYRITSSGASASTYIPEKTSDPVAPTVSVSPANGSAVAVNKKITVTIDDGNDEISSAVVTLTAAETELASFTYSDFTNNTLTIDLSSYSLEAGESLTLTASAINTAGEGSAGVSYTTVAAPVTTLVTNPNELRIYQVMVSSFQDGDPNIGYTTAYGPSGQLTGGDLQGIINAADYISELGFNALWMTPIFQSAGNGQLDSTGYFCSDYFNVDNHFGTNDKLRELISVYHEKGIAVILDGVFGHHGGSVANSPSGYNVSGKNPVNYTDTNTQNFYKEVASYWIKNYKIDGWRLDQCYQVGLGESGNGNGDNCQTGGHNYWYDIRCVVADAASSNGTKGSDWGTLGYMVGEHWKGDAALIQKGSLNPGSAAGYGLQSCFDFPSRYKIINALAKAESDAGGESLAPNLSYVYKTSSAKGYTHPDGYIPNLFVTNHDLVRLGNLINWKHSETPSSENYWKRHKLALAIVTAYTGPITVYYGDEWGAYVEGYTGPGSLGAYNDNAARSTGKISGFDEKQQDLHDYAAALMTMRREHEALWNGTNTDITSTGSCYVGKKVYGNETIYFAINNSTSSKTFSATGTDLLTGTTYSGTVTVPALSAAFVLSE